MYKPTSHYLFLDFMVILGPDIDKTIGPCFIEIKTPERKEQLYLSKQTGFC